MLNAPTTALVLEGGGMRNSYTAPMVDQLIAKDVNFGWVGGVSAGATHTANFLAKDRNRAVRSFGDFASDPRAGGLRSFLRGSGYFNGEYAYEISGLPDSEFPFDWDTFSANETPFRIGATRADNGESVYWGREDISGREDFMRKLRCSGTMPGLMRTPTVDGVAYVDGALGASGGLLIDAAIADGFDKFFVVRTRPRGFRRVAPRSTTAVKQLLRTRPAVAEAMLTRHLRYNKTAKLIEDLEAEGKARVFYPDDMRIANTERNPTKLRDSFNAGMAQTVREWDDIMDFLQE